MRKTSCSRDRLVVRTLRCGRNNPGSNPGHGKTFYHFIVLRNLQFLIIRRTRNCEEYFKEDYLSNL
ncbi:hypothetical protein T11_8139 [Trichinella zimbabwensis]|uniref:Uncharacterized protein n=1 Tax=Trichinella zimbabwensis TaxID=268475 RepID=A0A0V1HX96_9BILA|nr:hypothetical protein T11_8139 [Trichinella zimbabwensis]